MQGKRQERTQFQKLNDQFRKNTMRILEIMTGKSWQEQMDPRLFFLITSSSIGWTKAGNNTRQCSWLHREWKWLVPLFIVRGLWSVICDLFGFFGDWKTLNLRSPTTTPSGNTILRKEDPIESISKKTMRILHLLLQSVLAPMIAWQRKQRRDPSSHDSWLWASSSEHRAIGWMC
jgi:hypothetical protein